MAIDILVPQMGESVTEGVIAQWLKNEGDTVSADEPLVEVETDKITVEVPAPSAGVLTKQSAGEGDTVNVGDIIGSIDADGAAASAPSGDAKQPPAPAAEAQSDKAPAMPAARAEAQRTGVDLGSVDGTGRGGRVLKEDVQRAASSKASAPKASASKAPASPPAVSRKADEGRETRKKMTPLRRRVAERLVQSQHTAAILTTFNEVDMSAVIALRSKWKQKFVDNHGVKLGFMSFFVKAAIKALKAFPPVNAEIDGEEVIYKHYYDVGVAVGGGKGLVVPVIRDADRLSFAEIEKTIGDYGKRAKDNKLTLDELTGGTFTISNGGVYGSMLSTPILNPPQTGILGLHNIVERAVVVDGKVEVRPVMYLALSYDHRLIDGREAVRFLVTIKEALEDPERLFLGV
ncbi:MAG: 2-oxoglutarate dehydrogenase complex dihydrolipoyllysine-residue succinyltransferase [Nannocystaceae bacterium]|nr:2-oxoglutarate dehydrogenase complex dihydrolipoyllysine-residue succinyltransferase [bacterium]